MQESYAMYAHPPVTMCITICVYLGVRVMYIMITNGWMTPTALLILCQHLGECVDNS